MIARAREHAGARERWAIGTPYRGEEHATLVVRPRGPGPPARLAASPPAFPIGQRRPLSAAAAATLSPGAALAVGEPSLLAGLVVVPVAVGWAGWRLARVRRALHDALDLDAAAYALRDAYLDSGEISAPAGASLAIEPRASGHLRVWLKHASPDESARFTRALDEIIDAPVSPRYLVSRLTPGGRSALAALGSVLRGRPPFDVRWAAVPSRLRAPQGPRRDVRSRLADLAWPERARLHAAQRHRPDRTRDGPGSGARPRDPAARDLGLSPSARQGRAQADEPDSRHAAGAGSQSLAGARP